MEITKYVLIEVVNTSKSKSEILKKLELSDNGRNRNHLNKLISEFGVSLDILKKNKRINTKFIEKECPVCGKIFETKKTDREKTTCSYSCSNSYFRSGENNPNWKDDSYRTTCFLYHEKKCVVCGEDKIIDVHHYDENKKNNNKENLIEKTVNNYRDDFIKRVMG